VSHTCPIKYPEKILGVGGGGGGDEYLTHPHLP
jgi:hypothetical protein